MDAFQIITLAFLIINLSFLISSIAHTLLSKDKEEPNPRVSIAPSVLSTQSCRSQHSLQPQNHPPQNSSSLALSWKKISRVFMPAGLYCPEQASKNNKLYQ
ncbi:uncharacterized protein LOC126368812 isoform X1 [Pectinophora gossypiella]|uniref:uncharacterized protein LOC126368812 isoform X1 n=1 Tax=Pectinophora gossypiella TaxID=13191 RepID=UPI00214F0DBE|nr:uncharacterized protein LOC126368812 isoform X1 [Pectinophora gossypiella]